MFIVNFSCVELGEFKFFVVVVLFCNLLLLILVVFLVVIVIIVLKFVVVFFCRLMKNIDLICEGLEIVYCKIKLFFL